MPPGLSMRLAPRTSTPVIGARDFLLHRGGAVDETTRETQAHFQLAVSIWHMLEHKLGTQWDVWSAAIYLYHHGVAHMKRSSSPSLSQCLVDSATAVEKEVARADDGSACPGCRTHG